LGFDFASFDGFSAAITTIVRASTVVVEVVAVAISFVIWELAAPITFFAFGIFALAFVAVFFVNGASFNGFSTAISTIVLTTTVVVAVIAIAISFVVRELAAPFAVGVALIVRIQTFASLSRRG